jgi:purine-binding chemotaxis protein CheW
MLDVSATLNQLCTFRLGPLYLGINVTEVREVLLQADITTVPHADDVVEGLINLRGQIATCIDLRRRLGLEARDGDLVPIHVVTMTDGEPVTLLVDAVGDVVEVDPEAYETPPSTMDPATRELILGAYKLDTELLLVLDLDRVTHVGAGGAHQGEDA